MIVRFSPHHQIYGDPVTPRERRYVRLAWGTRSEKRIGRRLGVHPTRVGAIAKDLGLGPRLPLPHHNEPASTMVEVPTDVLRRCQECERPMLCRHCKCGWEALV